MASNFKKMWYWFVTLPFYSSRILYWNIDFFFAFFDEFMNLAYRFDFILRRYAIYINLYCLFTRNMGKVNKYLHFYLK